jgi:alpha-L-fucosidase
MFNKSFSSTRFVHETSQEYVWPTDKNVLEKLDRWQDLKFGVLFHWGLYSVPGIVESWSICSEDEDWIPRDSTIAYDEYKKWYWGLIDRFNPTQFNPEQWAQATKDGGMKYMIFTTKHHDGFNLFDTKQTNFSITHGAFKDNPHADVTKYILEAFRNKGFMVGTYFSKPDWHSEYYWWPYFATPTRNVNYKINAIPIGGKSFRNLPPIRFLIDDQLRPHRYSLAGWRLGESTRQDIKMDDIIAQARQSQPGLIAVDRTVHGANENYLTPERSIPEKQLPYPWESCITLGTDWGWTPNAKFKTADEVISLLVEVTAKGGNLLLASDQPQKALSNRSGGSSDKDWSVVKMNGEAIYNTRITPDYHNGNVWFTQSKDQKTRYAIYIPAKDETPKSVIEWENNLPMKGSKMVLLQNGKTVKWQQHGNSIRVYPDKKTMKERSILAFSFQVK